MGMEETLRKVEQDCARGDYGKARDRLHGLISTYPGELALRAKLGQVYWDLHHPAMAGLYWYLEERTSAEMDAAREAFERRHGNDPVAMLRSLKYRGDIGAIRDSFAERRLLALQQRADERRDNRVRPQREVQDAKQDFRTGVVVLGCFILVLAFVLLLLIGFISVHH